MKIKRVFESIFECENKVLIFLSIFFLFGIACGSFYGCKNVVDDMQEVGGVLADYFSENLGQVFLKNFAILIIVFLLGYTVIGTPFICFAVLYEGICCGMICGMFGVCYGFKGCVIAVLCFYFFFLINITAIIYTAFSSIRLSLALFNVFRSDTKYVSASMYSKPHIVKFIFFSLLILLGALYYFYISRFLYSLLI